MQRLRRWLLAGAVLFALMLAVLIGYTRYRALRARLNLPSQLGIDVKSQADGFTIQRSTKDGRPLFTIHASKAIQHKNGITTLHDVAVTLYGPKGSNRTDSIRGGEFDYDQANGVLRAMGETVLDVGIADGNNTPANAKRLTMQGKGLVYLQKLGIASTKEQIRFQYAASQGEAVGADYDADTGLLTLQHDVHLHSMEHGHPERIDASVAVLNRNTRIATLQNATLTDAHDSMRAPHMVAALRFGADGHSSNSLEKVDASGGVTVQTSTGQRVEAPELHADVTAENRLSEVTMRGGVHLADDQTNGFAQTALLRFANGHAKHLTLTGQARLHQSSGPNNTRDLSAGVIESALQQTGGSHLSLDALKAVGAAKLVMTQPAKQPGHTERTELTAPTLLAHTEPAARTAQIRDLEAGAGAHLVQDDGAGAVRTSTSDTLTAAFHQTGDTKHPTELQSILQQGHVLIHETAPAAAAPAGSTPQQGSQTDAGAERAEFQSSTNLLVLTGAPRVTSDGLQLSANRIAVHRDSGDAEASGAVRGTITQASAAPVSVHPPESARGTARDTPLKAQNSSTTQFAADSARLAHSTGEIMLQGGSADARLWSPAGQVEAPTIQANGKAHTLHAFGPAVASGVAVVKTVLLQQPGNNEKPAADAASVPHGPTRVFSHDLFYQGGATTSGSTPGKPGVANFRGGVRLLQGDDVVTADSAIATMRPAAAAQTGPLPTSGVQSLIADGHVHVQQGNRVATGSHLLYTLDNRNAVLTGGPGAPPVVRDPMQGTLTGTQLLLHLGQTKGDNQVEVVGAPSAPVHTDLDVPDKGSGPAAPARSRPGRKARPIQ